jgi:hypothetical protein
MNTVTVSGWLDTDPLSEHVGDLAICELLLVTQAPDGRRNAPLAVTCFGQLAFLAGQRLAAGDHVAITGWLRILAAGLPVLRVDLVAERLDFLSNGAPQHQAPDAHLEAAYDDRYELDEVS